MKNNQIKLLLAAIGLALVGFIIAWFKLFEVVQPQQSLNYQAETVSLEQPQKNISLTINFGDGQLQNFNYEFAGEKTAFDVLKETTQKENLPIETQNYDFGVLVKSIGGYENTTEKAWVYFVNGKSGTVAADEYVLEAEDVLEWKYLKLE